METQYIEPVPKRLQLESGAQILNYKFSSNFVYSQNSCFIQKKKNENNEEEMLMKKSVEIAETIEKSDSSFMLIQNYITCINFLNNLYSKYNDNIIEKYACIIIYKMFSFLQSKNPIPHIVKMIIEFTFSHSIYINNPNWFVGIILPVIRNSSIMNIVLKRDDFYRTLKSFRELHFSDMNIRHVSMVMLCKYVVYSNNRLDDIFVDIENFIKSYLDDMISIKFKVNQEYMTDICELHKFLEEYLYQSRNTQFINSYGKKVYKRVKKLSNNFNGDVKKLVKETFNYNR